MRCNDFHFILINFFSLYLKVFILCFSINWDSLRRIIVVTTNVAVTLITLTCLISCYMICSLLSSLFQYLLNFVNCFIFRVLTGIFMIFCIFFWFVADSIRCFFRLFHRLLFHIQFGQLLF